MQCTGGPPARRRSCLSPPRASSCQSRKNRRRRSRVSQAAAKRGMSIHHSSSSMQPKAYQVYQKPCPQVGYLSVPWNYPSVRVRGSTLCSHASTKTRWKWTGSTINSKNQTSNSQRNSRPNSKSSSLASKGRAWIKSPWTSSSSKSS